MKSSELRQKYLEFFASKGHAVIPSASLIPENDPTCLFTTAGMHPLVPFLLGEKHPAGSKLTSCQKCVRVDDIDSVGDAVHLTFFEMLGNWSLGNYWKKETIEMSFEFLTKILGFPIEKLAVSVFAGDEDAKFDEESFGMWKSLSIPENRIAKLSKKDNWWGPAGVMGGPCGPDTEMFFWNSDEDVPESFNPADSRWVEIWNDVFMEFEGVRMVNFYDDGKLYKEFTKDDLQNIDLFEKKEKRYLRKIEEIKIVKKLKQKNIDTGMGLDRVAAILQKVPTVFETDLFAPILTKIRELAKTKNEKSERIIADHLRAATFIIGDGVPPSNVDAGYVVRKLIRRAIREARKLGFDFNQTFTTKIAEIVIENFGEVYPELVQNSVKILLAFEKEEIQFKKTLEKGEREIAKFLIEREEGIEEFRRRLNWQKQQLKNNKLASSQVIPKSCFEIHKEFNLPKKLIKELVLEEGLEIPNDFDEEFDKEVETDGFKLKTFFYFYETYGFPKEMIKEFILEKGLEIPNDFDDDFDDEMKAHQEKSRTASAGKFAGGLADDSEAVARLHTATHLLNAALRKVLGEHVSQKGSNITAERLRFDFSHPEKMTPEQKAEVEKIVNEAIQKNLPIECAEMTVDEAKAVGATGVFNSKYGEKVKVFTIGDFSREICGGPHAKNTGELGRFKIKKEESSSAGVRRIKAVLSKDE